MAWKTGIVALDTFYLWDSMMTWAVRAHDGVRELNPVISQLHSMDPMFYFAFRLGAILLANVLFWQIYVEAPSVFDRLWFKAILLLSIFIYLVPFLMSLPLLVVPA